MHKGLFSKALNWLANSIIQENVVFLLHRKRYFPSAFPFEYGGLKGYYIMKIFFKLASDIKIDEGGGLESEIKTFFWSFIKELKFAGRQTFSFLNFSKL